MPPFLYVEEMKRITNALARGKFAIEAQTGLSLFPQVHAFLRGQEVNIAKNEDRPPIQAGIIVADWTRALKDYTEGNETVEPGSIGLITVFDTVMKEDYCGWSGTMTMANQLKWMDENQNIAGIIIEIDSPGGQVDGTATFADAIKNAATPVVAVVNDGMACSAAYWIASAADKIYATHNHSEVGSIGVYSTLADYSKYYEEKGIRVEDVYAEQSTEKNKGYRDWLAGDSAEFVKRLSSIATEFIDTVKTNRAGKLNTDAVDPFKGAVFNAKQALAIGLIDGIKSFDQVVAELEPEKLKLSFI